ncbi:MAG: uroporphyrinogen-III synthase [Polyangiaceae bacterium]|nr:uroporphyrinogen-III synthase [Polyangiaceae bacterium]
MGKLVGKRVLVLRAREQAASVTELLRARGAEPVVMPILEFHPPTDPRPMIAAIGSLAERGEGDERHGWVVFTSANGVERVLTEIARQGMSVEALGNMRVAAVGPATASALTKAGIKVDLVAREHHGEGLAADMLAAIGNESPKPSVLLLRAEVARDVLPETLREAGCKVDIVSVYKTAAPSGPLVDGLVVRLEAGDIDAILFTSPSSVNHLCDALDAHAAHAENLLSRAGIIVASIGPVTTEAAHARGVKVDVTARPSTMAALVEALENHFDKKHIS